MNPVFKQSNVITCQDFDNLVKELYDIDFDFIESIPDELVGHYTYHEFDVDGETELDLIFDDRIVEHWINTGQYQSIATSDLGEVDGQKHWTIYADVEAHHILNRMFKDGHISAGKYFITVDW